VAAGAPAGEAADTSGFVDFAFDRVEVATFVRMVGDMTGKSFVVDESVKGKITVVSPRVARKDVYPLFLSVLESAGCSVVDDGKTVRVVALAPRVSVAAPVVGAREPLPPEGIVTKVFRLQYVTAAQVRRLIEGRVSGGKTGAVNDVEETNHLVVTDTVDNLKRVERVIAEIDQPGLAQTTEVVALRFTAAEPLADQLNQALAERTSRADRLARRLPAVSETSGTAERGAPVIVAVPDSNSLLLVGAPAQIADIKRLVALMDVEAAAGRGRLNAIFLKYIPAAEAAKQIDALLSRSAGAAPGAPSAVKRPITIEASPASNALMVHATPGDFENVRKLIEQIDQPRQQVHIEVMIAEVSAGEGLNFGVELAAVDLPARVGQNAVQAGSRFGDAESVMNAIQTGLFPKGLTVGVAHGSRLDASGKIVSSYPALINIDAVRASTRFKVLSHTALETQDNQEASVNIVNQIPILKSTVQGTGTTRDVIQNIDRVDVGIKLKLTPHVIPGGQVQMVLNPSIEAVVDAGPPGTVFAPTIARRDVTTTVTVPDSRTIIIAGLTREDKRQIERRVPLLGSIPVLGWLFRSKVDSVDRTNVLIFVTPKVLTNALASAVVDEWKQKTGMAPNELR